MPPKPKAAPKPKDAPKPKAAPKQLTPYQIMMKNGLKGNTTSLGLTQQQKMKHTNAHYKKTGYCGVLTYDGYIPI